MTDLEITKLCAEAMGYVERDDSNDGFVINPLTKALDIPEGLCVMDKNAAPILSVFYYNPIHDHEHAMALVKKFQLSVWCAFWSDPSSWHAEYRLGPNKAYKHARNIDLNRAICECVAAMQKEKETA